MDHGVTVEYIKNLDKEANALVEKLASGKCKNHEEYKFVVGQIRGLEHAKSVLHDTLKSFTTDYQDFDLD